MSGSRSPAAVLRLLIAASLAGPVAAVAQQRGAFPAGATYIIQLTGSQGASGLGEYLVPPLKQAMDRAGLVYLGGPGVAYAATVQNAYDVGKWHGDGAGRRWLHTRTVTVGLTPAHMELERAGRLAPAFSVSATLITPDADRVDELNCLIALAARELKARYRPQGRVSVDGTACLRAR